MSLSVIPSAAFHKASDIAVLPLIKQFQISNDVSSPVIQAILIEQQLSDSIDLIETKLSQIRDSIKQTQANLQSKHNHSSNTTNANSKNKRKQVKPTSASSVLLTKQEELQQQTTNALYQTRANLTHQQSITAYHLQQHYSITAPKLDPVIYGTAHIQAVHDDFMNAYDELLDDPMRMVYVKEMIPVIKASLQVADFSGTQTQVKKDIFHLPYVQKLHIMDPQSKVILALVDEMRLHTIYHKFHERIYGIDPNPTANIMDDPSASTSKSKNKYKSKNGKNLSTQMKKISKILQQNLEDQTAKTTTLIHKHYRKQSLRLHPDRKGEEYRPIFEEFRDARDVLIHDNLRIGYGEDMLKACQMNFFKGDDYGFLIKEHEDWVKRHEKDLREAKDDGDDHRHEGMKKKKGDDDDDAAGNQKKSWLALEGGLCNVIPKSAWVKEMKGKKRTVDVQVQALAPVHEFYSRVRSIKVVFSSVGYTEEQTNGGDNLRLRLVISREDIVTGTQYDERGNIYGNTIRVGEMQLPSSGDWEVYWYADFDTVGTDARSIRNATEQKVESKHSSITVIRLEDEESKKYLEAYRKAELSCKKCIRELQNVRKKTTNHGSAEQSALDRFGDHHRVVVRAGQRARGLKWAMKHTGNNTNATYDTIQKELSISRQSLSELEDRMESVKKKKNKKDNLKRFKAFVASVLESADPLYWMIEVTEKELGAQGGDANRLYQLFIEGKGRFQLMVDTDVLEEASLRDDLFSSRQCAELAARREQVLEQEAKEEEKERAAEAKKVAEEEKRLRLAREAELQHKWSMLGNTVAICGLESKKGKALNGEAARVIDYSVEKDRFEVCCVDSGMKAYLKEENFTVYFYGDLAPAVAPSHVQSEVDQAPDSDSNQIDLGTPIVGVVDADVGDARDGDNKEIPSRFSESNASSEIEKTEGKRGQSVYKKTIIVNESCSNRLIGKKGRRKKELMSKSGTGIIVATDDIEDGRLPVHIKSGDSNSIKTAISLIEEVIGFENIYSERSTGGSSLNLKLEDPPASGLEPELRAVHNAMGTEGNFEINTQRTKGTSLYTADVIESKDASLYASEIAKSEFDLPSEIGANIVRPIGTPQESITPDVSICTERSQVTRQFMQPETTTERLVNSNRTDVEKLHDFLRRNQNCIKGSVDGFLEWLVTSEDIDSMSALQEAVSDDEYLQDTLQKGNGVVGLKGFKRKTFKRSVIDYPDETNSSSTRPNEIRMSSSAIGAVPGADTTNLSISSYVSGSAISRGNSQSLNGLSEPENDPPRELYCPIDSVLMTEDPVLAADFITYERRSIERWFQMKVREIMVAEENLRRDPSSLYDLEVVRRGIRSPTCDIEMPNLTLVSNASIRNMARSYKAKLEGGLM